MNGRDSVRDTVDAHGTNTLSTLGGYAPGQLVGPAYAAAFILAVTEDVRSETPVEEDNWAAAAEWAEALGADVISSSLGYLDFDLPVHLLHRSQDMNGETGGHDSRRRASRRTRHRRGELGRQRRFDPVPATRWGRRPTACASWRSARSRAPASRRRLQLGRAHGRWPHQARRGGDGRRVVVARHVGNFYGVANGTSFSCPLTAGVVALLLQAHPTYTVDDVLTVLRGSASQASAPDTLLGWGIVDAVAAVDMPLPTPVAAVP